jgi:hypothetical protein
MLLGWNKIPHIIDVFMQTLAMPRLLQNRRETHFKSIIASVPEFRLPKPGERRRSDSYQYIALNVAAAIPGDLLRLFPKMIRSK